MEETSLEEKTLAVLSSQYFLHYVRDGASLKSLLHVLRGKRVTDAFRHVVTQFLRMIHDRRNGRWIQISEETEKWVSLESLQNLGEAKLEAPQLRGRIVV